MKLRIVNAYSGIPIIPGRPRRTKKKDKDEVEITRIKQKKYVERQVDFGRMSFTHLKDLQDGSRRKLYKSEISQRLLYGTEWSEIRGAIRILKNFTCEECGRQFEPHNLNVHHITPINTYIQSGRGIMIEEYESYGTMTNKPWHAEDNLILLCYNHHAERHSHMRQRDDIKPLEADGRWKKKKKKKEITYIKMTQQDKDEQRRRLTMVK